MGNTHEISEEVWSLENGENQSILKKIEKLMDAANLNEEAYVEALRTRVHKLKNYLFRFLIKLEYLEKPKSYLKKKRLIRI